MLAEILEQGSYVCVECPHCKAIRTLFDSFNPDDSAALDEFEGLQIYTCEECNKFFDVQFDEF